MPRETTIKLEFDLSDPDPTALTLKSPGITKSTAAGTAQAPATTVIHTDPATAPTTAPKAGDLIMVSGTGWKSIDGKLVRVTAFDGTSGDLTVAADTFAENTTPTLADIKAGQMTWHHACLSEFSANPGTPGEVDATTMCDTARVTLPGLASPGTASFSGFFDLDDAGMKALMDAEEDAKPRYLIAKSRRGQMAIFHGVVSSFSIGSLTVEGAIPFTGNFTLDKKPTYAKAA